MDRTFPKSLVRLNITQFLGALNDNFLKLLIIFHLIRIQGAGAAGVITALAGAAFVIPFLLFAAPAGSLADRLPKSRMITNLKGVEAVVSLLAVAALAFGLENGLYGVVFLMAAHSAFFAPAKYGIIPELVKKEELSKANGLIESCTFLGIIGGTALASLLSLVTAERPWLTACFSLAVALAGLWSASTIGTTEARAPGKKVALFPAEIFRTISGIRSDRDLMLAIIGLAFFMFVAAFTQMNLIGYGMERLGLDEARSGYLFLAAALGIGIGSLLSANLSGRNVEFGIVPIGAAGITASALLLHAAPENLAACLGIVVVFGISAGLFSLPLQTFIQFSAEPARRGQVLAASTFISWIGIFLASGVIYLFSKIMGLSAAGGFSVLGGLTLVLTILSFLILPDFFLRFLALMAMHIFYRIRITGEENVPLEGPALLVPNHVTWLDALLLTATSQRRIRFVMQREYFNTPVLRGLFRLMGAIPVSSEDSRGELVEFIRQARQALEEGYMVCIFAEGALTRTGMLREFRSGFERIVRKSGHPIIPVYIGGAWGSILSYAHGRLLSRLPAFSPYRVSIIFGAPMPSTSSAVEVRQAVMELSCLYFDSRKKYRKPLGEYFIDCAKRNWRRKAAVNASSKEFSYGRTLAGALVLISKLKQRIGPEEHVGILIPPTVGGVLTNLALSLMGRIPVNLNYTASEASLQSAVSQCGIKTVITSRAFLEKVPTLPRLDGMVMLEDIMGNVAGICKLAAFLKARLLPARLLCSRKDFNADRPATVIFSSGSTGEPKGVVLTHHNIMSNIEALRMVFRVNLNDNICSALPFFHSLGFTGTLWFPLVSGFSAAYHTNPMDGEKIAQMARENRSTLLIATPTFLLAYLRRARKEDFASLRLVMTGAEKLKPRLADAFQEKFGVRPMEGYGATELSPVITLSLPDVELGGVRQKGSKEGSVGQPIPGVAVRVVDPDTGEPVGPGKPGLILVKGPNVMLGYLGRADKTAEALRDGWYVTGDIGAMDEDGFVRLTDRLARFSKIAGEMVPHGVIEDELHSRLEQNQVLAVTSVPDEKKGEKLVVVYTREASDAETLHRLMMESPLPNLWKPGRDCYVAVDSLPVLGTGKLDLKGLKEIASAAMGGAA